MFVQCGLPFMGSLTELGERQFLATNLQLFAVFYVIRRLAFGIPAKLENIVLCLKLKIVLNIQVFTFVRFSYLI